jgi:hypothetical protein
MARPTTELSALIAEIEDHIGSLNRLLDVLDYGLQNARRDKNHGLARAIDTEIQYTIRQLAQAKARRDTLRRS